MKDISRALFQELLTHHAHECRIGRSIDQCVILNGNLCERAGFPQITRAVGDFLFEIAEYSNRQGWPPINSLAVNAETRMPGDSYDIAPGCSLLEWPTQVRDCIDCPNYPERI